MAAGWVLFVVEDGNQFAGVSVVFSWILALAVAGAGGIRDLAHR